jgi:hypothetical protein
MLQHLTVQQCFERMGGAMEDFTNIVFADFGESGVKQIQVSALLMIIPHTELMAQPSGSA